MSAIPGPILATINDPSDLRKLKQPELLQLCKELRQFIIDEVSCNPGHLGASLGVVELTVALHYVLDTPYDLLTWDVGHQAYSHKILTGRRDLFWTNRKLNGICGFPRPSESIYDSFIGGHASTSISAALGMATAAKYNGDKNRRVVAVIGDGSMTGGLAFEGLNNAGINKKTNLLIILNDNNMAIDPNVGAVSEYLLDISTSRTYNKVKDDVWRVLGKISKWGPNAQLIAQKIDHGIKSIVLRNSNIFESLNLRYFGPVDGHDVVYMTKILKDLKGIPGPKVLHVLTKKGKGFTKAENDQTTWHAPGLFNKDTGEIISQNSGSSKPMMYQEVFGQTLLELAVQNQKIVGITPAMPTGCSMNIMGEKFPDRVFDVGIAEAHAVTFSAGLAAQGLLPFCNIYSSFLQRAFDQVIHDVALQKLPVVFCIDRGGLVGADGATHHGAYDLAYLRMIPGLIVSAPMNEEELRNLMFTAQLRNHGPFAIRYPKGPGVMKDWKKPFKELKIGEGRCLREGTDMAVLTIGHPGNSIPDVLRKLDIENISCAHYDMRFLKPIDTGLLHVVCKKFKKIITVEDGTITGGFGSAVLEFMAANNYSACVKILGIPDRFIEHGTQEELIRECGFHSEDIYKTAREMAEIKILSSPL